MREIVVDSFAGGGGASTGIEMALGISPDVAINHDPDAVRMHAVNHPDTLHMCQSIMSIDPKDVMPGRPVGLLWASPDCKHFSKAKGGKPVSRNIRDLAWVVVHWAERRRPRVIILENVEEFKTWGPLKGDRPDPDAIGATFVQWVKALRRCGYAVEWRELRACDYGAPTIRKRLFVIARCDGQPIVWPEPTHGPGLIQYRTAAECIDWSLPCPSIFETSKEIYKKYGVRSVRPLAENTMKRTAKGIFRYVIEAEEPFFITEFAQTSNQRNMSANEPLRTICAQVKGGHFALVSAFLAKHYTGVVGSDLREPIGTVTGIDHHSLVCAHIQRDFGKSFGNPASEPLATVTSKNKTALVTSHICKMRGDNIGHDVREPLHTISADGQHHAEVRAFLVKYYGNEKDGADINKPIGTVTTKDRFGLVMVHGEPWMIVDIGLRMLNPRELYRAQGFPENYIIDRDAAGKVFKKDKQIRMCGNSVCPPVAAALVRANVELMLDITPQRPSVHGPLFMGAAA